MSSYLGTPLHWPALDEYVYHRTQTRGAKYYMSVMIVQVLVIQGKAGQCKGVSSVKAGPGAYKY